MGLSPIQKAIGQTETIPAMPGLVDADRPGPAGLATNHYRPHRRLALLMYTALVTEETPSISSAMDIRAITTTIHLTSLSCFVYCVRGGSDTTTVRLSPRLGALVPGPDGDPSHESRLISSTTLLRDLLACIWTRSRRSAVIKPDLAFDLDHC